MIKCSFCLTVTACCFYPHIFSLYFSLNKEVKIAQKLETFFLSVFPSFCSIYDWLSIRQSYTAKVNLEHTHTPTHTPLGPCVPLLGVMCLRLARGPGCLSELDIPWKPPGGATGSQIPEPERLRWSCGMMLHVKSGQKGILVVQSAINSPWPLPPCCCHRGLGRIWASWFGA